MWETLRNRGRCVCVWGGVGSKEEKEKANPDLETGSVVEHLPSKHKAPDSAPDTEEKTQRLT